jgi:hypothetical protein
MDTLIRRVGRNMLEELFSGARKTQGDFQAAINLP